jgi:hypothetical protein
VKDRRIQVPCQPSGGRVIPSRRPSVHCSIRPNNVPYRPDARQTKHHLSGRCAFPSGPSTMSRSFYPACIRPDASQYSTSFRFFPSSNMGRLIQPPDDVVSRPDARLLKARIAIQMSLSGRQSALVRTHVQLIWKLPIRLQPSELLLALVRTLA